MKSVDAKVQQSGQKSKAKDVKEFFLQPAIAAKIEKSAKRQPSSPRENDEHAYRP